MCIKERPWQGLYDDGIATLDYERGKADSILNHPWQTDDSIGSWGYNPARPYMKPGLVVDKIVDIVSKNGNMLLNIPIKADGTLDKEATELLKEVGRWFKVNGEAKFMEHVLGTCLVKEKPYRSTRFGIYPNCSRLSLYNKERIPIRIRNGLA